MHLFLLSTLAMVAFAANSVLNRLALAGDAIDPVTFGTLRLLAGALTLAALVMISGRKLRLGGPGRLIGVASLLAYIFGFSLAYTALDAGLGALILFGVVQITMFAGALAARDSVPLVRWVGAAMAFGGLIWLLWPGATDPISPLHAGVMALAGLGWGLYSLAGRGATDALGATAANFILASAGGLIVSLLAPLGGGTTFATPQGLVLAILSGAVTSGLGYALWYRILPELGASVASVAQLTVPVIAMIGGMVFLSEALTQRFVICSILVLGGVALSVLVPQKAKGSKGS